MTLDELKKIVNKELPVNKNHLDTESLRGQELYAKFLDYKTNFGLFYLQKQKANTKDYTEKSGNTMVEKQMPKYMQQNHLT